MTPHETALVTILLERLKNVDAVPNDPEAETLIRESAAPPRRAELSAQAEHRRSFS